MAYKIDLTNQKFGNLTVIKYIGQRGRRRTFWLCKCDCGNIVEIDGDHLKSGHTKSCGCLSRNKIKFLNYKTGESKSKLYRAYRNMLNRCYRQKDKFYKHYGGRNIQVCSEWLGENGYSNFSKWAKETGYKEDKRGICTLDRIDVNGNYCPNNCRWVSQIVQCNNRRITRRIKINGEVDTVSNMSRKYNLNYNVLLLYSKGHPNIRHPELDIEVVDNE